MDRRTGVARTSARGVILYDFLYVLGGAESVTLDLAKAFSADVCCDFSSELKFPADALAGLHLRQLGQSTDLAVWRTLKGLWNFRHKTGFLDRYEWAIFSGSNAPVAVSNRRNGRNYYYCHTLPRFAYDLHDYYLDLLPPWQRPLLKALSALVRHQYAAALRRMDLVLANSVNVQGRLRRYLGQDSVVVNPPCAVDDFRWLGQKGYYVSTARLEPFKRVDTIVRAFRDMPDKQLVVLSGGSQLGALQALAGGAPNIRFTGWASSEEARRCVGEAIASIYVPVDEDFGMSPVESMAAGKPVIGVAEGGLLETVLAEQTGLLIDPPLTPESICEAVRSLSPEQALAMRPACEARAGRYGREIFFQKLRELLAID